MLYEFSVLLKVNSVIAAESEEAARTCLTLNSETLVTENGNADVVGVCDVELVDVRDGIIEEAHVVA